MPEGKIKTVTWLPARRKNRGEPPLTKTGVLKSVGDKYHLHITGGGHYIIDPDTVKRIV